jgi:serine/threonine protein kinase
MIPYADPKSFDRQTNKDSQTQMYLLDEKSDVYSIGILLWEISSGRPPFHGESHDFALIGEILKGRREEPVSKTPKDYVKIYIGKKYNLKTFIIYKLKYQLIKNIFYLDCWNSEPD